MLLGRTFDATGTYTIALVALGCIALVSGGLIMTLPAVPTSLGRKESEILA
jgi:hypothetical protein